MSMVRNFSWYRPITTWAVCVAVLAGAYFALEGPGAIALVRALAGAWLLLFAGVVVAVRAYYAEANKRARDPDRGALPQHVRQISESYTLAILFIVAELWTRAGQSLTWRIPLAVLIAVRGLQGLVWLIAFERRRVYVVAPFVTDLRGAPHERRLHD